MPGIPGAWKFACVFEDVPIFWTAASSMDELALLGIFRIEWSLENVLFSRYDYFSRDERPGLLLCGDVLCKQDCWREEMVGLRQLTNHSLL